MTCPIWDFSSPFMKLLDLLDAFKRNLPERFRLDDLNSYALQDQHILNGVTSLHTLYHAAIFDLTRISLAGFNFSLSLAFRDAHLSFRSQCQERCRFHANEVSNIIQTLRPHGREPFDDPFCADAALESAKVQIVYSATVGCHETQIMETTKRNLRINLDFLQHMRAGKSSESLHVRSALFYKHRNPSDLTCFAV